MDGPLHQTVVRFEVFFGIGIRCVCFFGGEGFVKKGASIRILQGFFCDLLGQEKLMSCVIPKVVRAPGSKETFQKHPPIKQP